MNFNDLKNMFYKNFKDFLSIFPLSVLGNAAMNVMYLGTLYLARFYRQKSSTEASSSDESCFKTTNAWPTSPHFSSGVATTAAATTAGCR